MTDANNADGNQAIHPEVNNAFIADQRSRQNKWRKFYPFVVWFAVLTVLVPGPALFVGMKYFGLSLINPNVAGLLCAAIVLPILGLGAALLLRGDTWGYEKQIAIAENVNPVGLRYSPNPDKEVIQCLKAFDMFGNATSHQGSDHVSGTLHGLRIDLFYHLATYGVGKYSVNYLQTIAIVHDTGANLPNFTVAEKGWLDSLKKLAGVGYAQLPGNPEFSERFVIRGQDMENIVARLTPVVVELIETHGLTVEALDDYLLIVLRKDRLAADEHRSLAELAIALADAFRGRSVRTAP